MPAHAAACERRETEIWRRQLLLCERAEVVGPVCGPSFKAGIRTPTGSCFEGIELPVAGDAFELVCAPVRERDS